jgi:trk system potassium uptake protein TrkH
MAIRMPLQIERDSAPLPKRKAINPPRIIVLSFASAVAIGAILLKLPLAAAGGRAISTIDALFIATSATCVTGLTVLNIGTSLSHFGQLVVLILIQAGGLGIMTLSTAFMVIFGRRLSFAERLVATDSLAPTPLSSMKSLIGSVLLVTFTCELVGAAILCLHFQKHLGYSLYQALYYAIFHCISAFCNAGFSLYSDNLRRFSRDYVTIATLGSLIVIGGLGFVVIYDLMRYRFWMRNRTIRGRISLQTKIAILISALLILVMGACVLTLEWNATLKQFTVPEKILNSFFHAVTPRTAGFNTIPVYAMGNAVLFITLFMMFVGASPGSTGGGIKTCTLAVIIATSLSLIRGDGEVRLMKRSLGQKTVAEALCVTFFAACLVIVVCALLLIVESDRTIGVPEKGPFLSFLFETVSAVGTVGLSTGATPSLSIWGKAIIIVAMFTGRVGPLTLALIIARRRRSAAVRYAEEDVMIG